MVIAWVAHTEKTSASIGSCQYIDHYSAKFGTNIIQGDKERKIFPQKPARSTPGVRHTRVSAMMKAEFLATYTLKRVTASLRGRFCRHLPHAGERWVCSSCKVGCSLHGDSVTADSLDNMWPGHAESSDDDIMLRSKPAVRLCGLPTTFTVMSCAACRRWTGL